MNSGSMSLAEAAIGQPVIVEHVGGERGFRRRLMELGLLPGTSVALMRVAPLGDPLELSVRGSRLSIRRSEARAIRVHPAPLPLPSRAAEPAGPHGARAVPRASS
jgi:ferrous iron transport protein A